MNKTTKYFKKTVNEEDFVTIDNSVIFKPLNGAKAFLWTFQKKKKKQIFLSLKFSKSLK